MEKEHVKKEIALLIDKYESMKKSGLEYSEQDVQTKLIKPLFNLLGWDVDGKKDITEVKEEVNYSGNRVDLRFSINQSTKLIVESKKFSILNIKGDVRKKHLNKSAIYGHSAGVCCVVLTNFEKFIFIDSQKEYISIEDTVFREVSYKDLLTDAGVRSLELLSKEGFIKNLLEDELRQLPGRGVLKKPINEQLLEELLAWRYELYKDIKSRYKFDKEKIDEMIQIILNRFIFIRMCEDKGFIPGNNLYSLIHTFAKKKLENIFKEIEKIYDGSLFEKNDCDDLIISDNVLKKIIIQLYYSSNRSEKYYFSAIPSDILGKMYEQYLNTLVNDKNKTQFNLKVKKEGIHYTDRKIVNYMVENAIKEHLKKNPDISNIKILDPACGSGSFLVSAYEYLENYYMKKGNLNYDKKREIIKNNLFGVDKDSRAIEIAKLNLHFKILEKGEKLPKIDNLISKDSLIDDYKYAKDKAFNWKEVFPFEFDIIIGNPPYVRQELITNFKPYLSKKYKVYNGTADYYTYFYEKSYNLLKDNGILIFISSNKFMRARYGRNLRKFLKENMKIIKIIDFKEKHKFEAITNTAIVFASKGYDKGNKFSFGYDIGKDNEIINQDALKDSEWTLVSEDILKIKSEIEKQGKLLKDWKVKIYRGILTGFNEAFIIDDKTKNELCKKDIKNEKLMKKVIRGRDIYKWGYDWKGFWLIFIPFGWTILSTKRHI